MLTFTLLLICTIFLVAILALEVLFTQDTANELKRVKKERNAYRSAYNDLMSTGIRLATVNKWSHNCTVDDLQRTIVKQRIIIDTLNAQIERNERVGEST